MAASSTDRLPPAGCTIAIVSTFFAPPPAYLSTPRILHLQGGVTLKTLPVLNYPVPLSPSFPLSPSLTHFFFHSAPRYILPTLLQFSPFYIDRINIIPEKWFLKFAQRQEWPVERHFEMSLSSRENWIFSENAEKNSVQEWIKYMIYKIYFRYNYYISNIWNLSCKFQLLWWHIAISSSLYLSRRHL